MNFAAPRLVALCPSFLLQPLIQGSLQICAVDSGQQRLVNGAGSIDTLDTLDFLAQLGVNAGANISRMVVAGRRIRTTHNTKCTFKNYSASSAATQVAV